MLQFAKCAKSYSKMVFIKRKLFNVNVENKIKDFGPPFFKFIKIYAEIRQTKCSLFFIHEEPLLEC